VVQGFSPNLVVRAIGEERFEPRDVTAIVETAFQGPVGAIVIGPGAGAAPETLEALAGLIPLVRSKVPVVVDADALESLGPAPSAPPEADPIVVATPNLGEFSRVFRVPAGLTETQRRGEAARIAREKHLTLVVKGGIDVITDGRQSAINRHHESSMAVA